MILPRLTTLGELVGLVLVVVKRHKPEVRMVRRSTELRHSASDMQDGFTVSQEKCGYQDRLH